jgi:hypothetical protein
MFYSYPFDTKIDYVRFVSKLKRIERAAKIEKIFEKL